MHCEKPVNDNEVEAVRTSGLLKTAHHCPSCDQGSVGPWEAASPWSWGHR